MGKRTVELANAAQGLRRQRVRSGRPIVRFVLIFAVSLIVLEAVWVLPITRLHVFPAYLRWSAATSAALLRTCGQPAQAHGTRIFSPAFSIEVRRGCDAIEPAALFLSGLIAFPVSWRVKWPAALLGPVILVALNLFRIASLFWVGVHFPNLFDTTHVDIWQIGFVFVTLLLWLVWLRWATRPAPELAHARQAPA